MRKVLLAWLVLLGMALAGAPKAIVEAGKAVYNLWRYEGGEMRILCTGTLVNTSLGLRFLTAGHCVEANPEGRYYISQEVDPQKLIRVYTEYWDFMWPENDYAVMKLPDGATGYSLNLCKQIASVGETVWAWTGPLGILPVLREGIYSGEIHLPDDPEAEKEIGGMYFVQVNGDGGSSGSALLRMEDNKACVWGIWVGGFVPRIKLDGALGVPIPKFL